MENTPNRFDLEENIMRCWNITDDIDLLYENVMESDMTKDDIANALLGMKTMYEMKFNKLWNNFETLIRENKLT